MYNLYENIYALCNEHHITPGGLCGELGFRRSVLSDLKSGRKKSLDTKTLMKISDYFGVSVDYLLTGAETEKAPTLKSKRKDNTTETAEKMTVLARHLDKIPDEARAEIVAHFENTVDMYLKAMGISKEDR